MSITYVLNEEFDGTRTTEVPDMENEGETVTTTQTGIRDVEVTFTCDDTDPVCVHTRLVNVCFDAEGAYDAEATLVRIGEVAMGVANKISCGVISNTPADE